MPTPPLPTWTRIPAMLKAIPCARAYMNLEGVKGLSVIKTYTIAVSNLWHSGHKLALLRLIWE